MLDAGTEKLTWEVGEWGKERMVRTENKPVRMALVIKTLETPPYHVEIVDLRAQTVYLISPHRDLNEGKKGFKVKVMKAYGLPKKKSKRW